MESLKENEDKIQTFHEWYSDLQLVTRTSHLINLNFKNREN